MTLCSNCGVDLEEHEKFCPNCGTRIETTEQTSVSPPPPIQPPAESQNNNLPTKQGILSRVDIGQEDIEDVTEKAKKGLGAAWRFARKGINKGAEIASQGIEAARDTIDERRIQQETDQPQQSYQASASPKSSKFCPNCGQPAVEGKFCNNCGHKLE